MARRDVPSYIERAMLLWPRLDRARLRRCGGDPHRIAGIVERRTAQPLAVILAMLTSQTAFAGPMTGESDLECRGDAPFALHIVHEPDTIELRDRVLA